MENESLSSKTKVILFTSCKGGVGKSTVCANLAMSVALLGKRVLVIDCDFGNRCMDILLGLSDEALYDIGDVIFGRVTPERAVIADRRSKNLFFVPAPYSFDSRFTAFAFRRAVAEYRDSGRYDFIFIDTPGGVGEPLLLSASVYISSSIYHRFPLACRHTRRGEDSLFSLYQGRFPHETYRK